jgi:hypothetical protein
MPRFENPAERREHCWAQVAYLVLNHRLLGHLALTVADDGTGLEKTQLNAKCLAVDEDAL